MNQQPKPDVTIMKSEVDMALYHSATSSQGCTLNTILMGIAHTALQTWVVREKPLAGGASAPLEGAGQVEWCCLGRAEY